jgi:hypothetical protein
MSYLLIKKCTAPNYRRNSIRNFLILIFCIFIILISCGNDSVKISDVIEKYIKKNNLPVTIGKEIIVYNDFNIDDKINFQVFMLDLYNSLADDISEGNFNDKTIEGLVEVQRIIDGFYKYCVDNNYELAIVFNNKFNEKDLLIDYLKYHNYNLTFYNNWIIFDNNTHYTELKNLIGILLQIGDIARNNLINFFHDRNEEDAHLFKKIVFNYGVIETVDVDYEYFDVVSQVELMNISYYLINDIIYLFRIKGYNLDIYENTWAEITEKINGFRILIDNFNSNRQ